MKLADRIAEIQSWSDEELCDRIARALNWQCLNYAGQRAQCWVTDSGIEGLADFTSLDTLAPLEQEHFAGSPATRVNWVMNLRAVLEPEAPKNKIGQPLVSDTDLLLALPRRRAEAFYLTVLK